MKKLVSLFLGLSMILALTACSSNSRRQTVPRTRSLKAKVPRLLPKHLLRSQQNRLPRQTQKNLRRIRNPKKEKHWLSTIRQREIRKKPRVILQRQQERIHWELVPVEPYTDEDLNYNDDSSRVVYEHDNPDARTVELVESTVSDWESYDTVFIGYPIWWGIAAWPVDGFIAANDFTGKTVIPFCTSASSGLGESGELLAEAAGTGNWLEGIRFSSNVSETDVQTWLEGLEL